MSSRARGAVERGDSPRVLVQTRVGAGTGWLDFRNPVEALEAERPDAVPPLLERLDAAARDGLWAAGFLTYEAAPAFDPAFVTRPPGPLPAAWFGLFERPRAAAAPGGGDYAVSEWRPSIERDRYGDAIARIRERIAAGDTYQINYTFRLGAEFAGDPLAFFADLAGGRRAGRAAYLDLGRHVVCSASPELFFRLSGDLVVARPMKGTVARGPTTRLDGERRTWLAGSEKNRAENLMIVDMVRNDLGRVARPGSVEVTDLFRVEKYESIYQMTSTVSARSDAPLSRLLAALFPCASITGAPKVGAMQIIAELEDSPRGIYTGAIGYLGPGREAAFNVAIRTVHVDRERGVAEFGTGGGIVWDSDAEEEYAECRTKARVLAAPLPRYALLETLAWDPDGGYRLLSRHLERLIDSAAYFDFRVDPGRIVAALERFAAGLPAQPRRVRLEVSDGGETSLTSEPLAAVDAPWRLAFAAEPVDPDDPFLYHKTTWRDVYRRARDSAPGYDDVVLWNPAGEVTESTVANVVARIDGALVTPPVECGLLAGTFRAELLAGGEVRERAIPKERLAAAEELFLVNSVRGWIPARLEAAGPAAAETRERPHT